MPRASRVRKTLEELVRVGGEEDRTEAMRATVFIDEQVERGVPVLVHCVGGLGRSGTVVASWLCEHGMSAGEAIAKVRTTRSPRAIENERQLDFVRAAADSA